MGKFKVTAMKHLVTFYRLRYFYRSNLNGERETAMIKMTELVLTNKRVLIREDFNVPLEDGRITSDVRIKAALPTIQMALDGGAQLMLMSHLGRPVEGEVNPAFSLAPVAQRLSELIDRPVHLIANWQQGFEMPIEGIALLENVRFQKGERKNDHELAKKMAALCDIFVMDAFATAHRAEASTYGVAEYAPLACAGPLLVAELEALAKVMAQPQRPLLAIVGGSKVSTKLQVLESLLQKVDQLIVGGGIANTFLAAAGYPIGCSLYEPDLLPQAKRLMALAQRHGVSILLPQDAVTAPEFSPAMAAHVKAISAVGNKDMILDIGPLSSQYFNQFIAAAGTILWNGPVGAFELSPFSGGTKALAHAIAESNAFSVAGGGDTLAAIEQFHLAEQISYISTGGGAFLEFIEGKPLPAVAILEASAKR